MALVRSLHERCHENHGVLLLKATNLRARVNLSRVMQVLGVSSFFGCVLCMFLLFA